VKPTQTKEKLDSHIAKLRSEIDAGLDQIKRGEVIDGQEVFDRVLEKNRRRPRTN
jgi:predicted transcriptional regulator